MRLTSEVSLATFVSPKSIHIFHLVGKKMSNDISQDPMPQEDEKDEEGTACITCKAQKYL